MKPQMTRSCSTHPISARFLQIGTEVVPVYGDDQTGWSLDSDNLPRHPSAVVRYKSLDELFFVLVNMTVNNEGNA